jgi:hypothetical protein
MSYLVGFAPWIAFWVIAARNGDERETLLVACIVALAISLGSLAWQGRRIGVSSLDVGGILFFVGFAIATQVVSDSWLDTYNQFVSNTALFTIVAVGLLIGKPFTATYARAATPQVVWSEPHFVHMNTVVTRGWVAAFGIMAASSAVLLAVPATSTNELILNWIIPFSAFGACISWQGHYIAAGIARGRTANAERLAAPIAEGAPVVTCVDHVTTSLPAEDARRLAHAMHGLKLMRAWDWNDFGEFETGGWRIGNVNLEVLGIPPDSYIPDRFVTLAPTSLNGLPEELDRRGIAHEPLAPQNDEHGDLLYTRIPTPAIVPGYGAQLCAYALKSTPPGTEAPDNPAGLRHVEEVTIASRDVDAAALRWAALLAPLEPGRDGVFRPADGPAIRLVPGADEAVIGIVVAVHDLDRARDELARAELAVDEGGVTLGALRIELTSTGVPASVSV